MCGAREQAWAQHSQQLVNLHRVILHSNAFSLPHSLRGSNLQQHILDELLPPGTCLEQSSQVVKIMAHFFFWKAQTGALTLYFILVGSEETAEGSSITARFFGLKKGLGNSR